MSAVALPPALPAVPTLLQLGEAPAAVSAVREAAVLSLEGLALQNELMPVTLTSQET